MNSTRFLAPGRLWIPRLILPVLAALLIAGCASRLTPENFAKIKTGMTPDDVTSILGKPDETQSQGALGLTGTTYVYHKGTSEAKVVFLNNQVIATDGDLK